MTLISFARIVSGPDSFRPERSLIRNFSVKSFRKAKSGNAGSGCSRLHLSSKYCTCVSLSFFRIIFVPPPMFSQRRDSLFSYKRFFLIRVGEVSTLGLMYCMFYEMNYSDKFRIPFIIVLFCYLGT